MEHLAEQCFNLLAACFEVSHGLSDNLLRRITLAPRHEKVVYTLLVSTLQYHGIGCVE